MLLNQLSRALYEIRSTPKTNFYFYFYLSILIFCPSIHPIEPQILHFHENRHSLRPEPFCHLIWIFAKPMANFPPDSLILSHSPFSPKLSLYKGSLLISHLNSQMCAKFAIFVTFSFLSNAPVYKGRLLTSPLNFRQPSRKFLPDLPFSPLNAFLDISV